MTSSAMRLRKLEKSRGHQADPLLIVVNMFSEDDFNGYRAGKLDFPANGRTSSEVEAEIVASLDQPFIVLVPY